MDKEASLMRRPHGSGRVFALTLVLIIVAAASLSYERAAGADASRGQITGTVLDEKTGEAIVGASIVIEGTTIGAPSDLDGRYAIRNAPLGICTLVISSLGHTSKRITGITVAAGRAVVIDVALPPQSIELKPIEVTVERVKGTEASLLVKRRTSLSVTDGVSAEMIRKSGDANAGDALRRVTGVSVVDGRSLVVRGMGGRYSNVRLNGATLPSPEPERREVPLDLFPSGLLQDIVTSKTYTPDQPGSFSGGMVDLATKEFPSKLIVNFSTSTSYGTTTTGKERLASGGGQKQFLGLDMGVDNGDRGVPDVIKNNANWASDSSIQRVAGLALADRRWTPTRAGTPVNGGYSLNIGDRLSLGGQRELGFVASWTYNNGYRSTKERYTEWDGYGPSLDYHIERGVQSVLWGGLLSSTLKLSDNHKLSLAGMYNRIGEDEARSATGFDVYSDQNVAETRLRFLSRRISSLQVSGDHNLPGLAHSIIHWRASTAAAGRSEPGSRSNLYFLNTGETPEDTLYRWYHTGYSGASIFTDLKDHDAQFALDWTLPLGRSNARLKLGTFAESKDRAFAASRYLFDSYGQAPANGLAESIFVPANIGSGRNQFRLENGTFADDHYDANEHNTAVYLMSDFPVFGHFRFVGGARYEHNLLTVNSADRSYPATDPRSKVRIRSNPKDWLPMASVIWTVSERTNVRGVVSRTIARPEYRELSQFAFQDYALGPLTVGNPNLKTTYIMNYDLRWEIYPQPGQLLAVSVFWKTFKDPIERVVSLGSSGSRNTFTFENSAAAYDRGIELEGRKSLDFLSSALSGVTLGGNVTFVSSHVRIVQGGGTLELNRPLHGQSPYTINTVLSYTSQHATTEISALYNVFGDRLISAGRWPTDPMYEKSRHQLDMTFGQKLWQGLSLKATAKNLLDARYRVTQKQLLGDMAGKEGVVQEYRYGLTFGVGLTYSF